MKNRGIIVASDEKSEWLLPWWWEAYSISNTLPVVFIDLGMTQEKISWCQSKGKVIALKSPQINTVLPEKTSEQWSEIYGKSYLSCREAWFKKPYACLLSPFEETMWIDVDCEVLDSLDDAFNYLESECSLWYGSSLSVPKGLEEVAEAGFLCNSGVLLFKKDSSLIKLWAEKVITDAEKHFGDECILSCLIHKYPNKVSYLPEEYNWRISRGIPLQAKIIHWKGEWGKQYIASYGGLRSSLKKIFEA